MKKLSFHKNILAWFGLAFLILALMSYSSYRGFKQLSQEKDWVDHTYSVITDLKEILSDLRDVQSAQRGYVITGQKDYLSSYSLALPDIEENISSLHSLLADNAHQKERFVRVEAETRSRLKTAADVIATYDSSGQAAAFEKIKGGLGKKEMDEIRILITEMITQEEHLLDVRQYDVQQTISSTLKVTTSGFAVCTLILILVFWNIYRETLKREDTEESLQSALQNMEQANFQTSLISKLSDYLQSCQTIEEAFRVIGSALPQLLAGTSGSVAMFRNSRNLVETVSKWGDETTHPGKDFNPEQCWGLRRGRAHYFVPGGTEPCCTHFANQPTGASLCLPMQAQGETTGLFSVVIDDVAKTSKEKVAFCRRVSEQISLALANLNLQNKLREQSIRDPLTRLFNRRYLELTLERELKRAERNKEPLSVLVLDIDHFKKFNDTLGHDAGDALLAQFATMLEQNVRKEDIVCRYGGEEFVVVLPMANLEMGMQRAQRICEATRQLRVKSTDKSITSVSVSIGVAAFPDHSKLGTELISIADSALYKSKHDGRDRATAADI